MTDDGLVEVVGLAYATCEAARAINYAAVHERTVADDRSPAAGGGVTRGDRPDGARSAPSLHGGYRGGMVLRAVPPFGNWRSGTTSPIAAGSLEVQLNLIARHLGFPKG